MKEISVRTGISFTPVSVSHSGITVLSMDSPRRLRNPIF